MGSAAAKRIILVGPSYPFRGGIAHFTQTLAGGLSHRGHDVSILTFTRQYPSVLFPGKTQYETTPPAELFPTQRLIDTLNPLSWRRAARHLMQQRPDLVVFQHWLPFFAPAYGRIARSLRKQGIRVLAVVHNALPHERRPGDEFLSRYFFKACEGFIVLSEAVEKDVRHLGVVAPVRRHPHPVYDHFGEAVPPAVARARLGLASEAPVLLFFGFVRRYKGLHVLLQAMPGVRERLPEVRLVVAGEFYEDQRVYEDLIQSYQLEQTVLLESTYIPQDEVALYFSAADVVVQPYLSATQSGVAQIAYHFGRPIIVTDVGGLAEVVPHEQAGLVVPPEDPAALAAAIVRFFEQGLQDALMRGVQQIKQRYSWDPLYESVEALAVNERS